jgi:hypothetical protein
MKRREGENIRCEQGGNVKYKKGGEVEFKQEDGVKYKEKGDVGCEEVGEALAPYLAGELKGPELEAVERHLGSCRKCNKLLSQETALNQLMEEGLCIRVDPGYWERIWPRVQIALAARRERRARLRLRWAFGTAGAFAAAALFIFIITRSVPAPALPIHDASYFANLPTSPPLVLEESPDQNLSLELANLSLGHPMPSERAATWQRMEGF